MTTAIIPVLAAMYLGSSFNLKTYQKGNADIYDTQTLADQIQVIDRSFTKSQYKLIESSVQAREFLDFDGALSLKIKSGGLSVDGSGAYLKDSANRQNFVELLIRVQHETVTETVPSYVKPKTEWMTMQSRHVGTHFVRSITYGGELVASLRLKASNRQEREIIKAAVASNLQLSGTFDLSANGSFDKLRKDLSGMYDEEIKITATKPPSSPPQTVEDLMKIVESYPKEIQEINNGKGKALKAELYPLSSMKQDYPLYLPNSALNSLLDDVESKYDDVRTTMADMMNWNKEREMGSDEEEEKVEEFFAKLQKTQSAFHKAIGEMDVSNKGDPKQFQEAFEAYGSGKDNIPNRFERLFWQLKHEIGDEELVWEKPGGSGVIYVNYGSKSCKSKSSTDTKLMYWGHAAGTAMYAWNGGRNSQCLPAEDPELKTFGTSNPNTDYLLTLQARDVSNPDEAQFLHCAVCLAKKKVVQEMFPAMTKCPDNWNLEYSGFLMADSNSNVDRDFICVNEEKDDYQALDQPSDSNPKLNPVFMNCESCESEAAVPCVVCTQ